MTRPATPFAPPGRAHGTWRGGAGHRPGARRRVGPGRRAAGRRLAEQLSDEPERHTGVGPDRRCGPAAVPSRGAAARRTAADPARRTAHELDRLLDRRGVRITGAPAVGRLPRGAVEVARIASPPLSELLAHTLRFSDNHLADGIFRMLGAAIGDPTWGGSADAARAALADVGVAWRGLRLADGSGLSRRNRLSAKALVEVLAAMADGPLRRRWLRLLPSRAGPRRWPAA